MTTTNTPSDPIIAGDASANTDSHNSSATNKRLSFKNIIETLEKIKGWLLLAMFFGGAIVGTINYFVTHEEFEALDCFTKLTVRQMQADANVKNNLAYIKQGKIELLDQQHILNRINNPQTMVAEAELLRVVQNQISALNEQTASFLKVIESEERVSQKLLTALDSRNTGKNVCHDKDDRKKILGQLRSGEL